MPFHRPVSRFRPPSHALLSPRTCFACWYTLHATSFAEILMQEILATHERENVPDGSATMAGFGNCRFEVGQGYRTGDSLRWGALGYETKRNETKRNETKRSEPRRNRKRYRTRNGSERKMKPKAKAKAKARTTKKSKLVLRPEETRTETKPEMIWPRNRNQRRHTKRKRKRNTSRLGWCPTQTSTGPTRPCSTWTSACWPRRPRGPAWTSASSTSTARPRASSSPTRSTTTTEDREFVGWPKLHGGIFANRVRSPRWRDAARFFRVLLL